MDLVAGNNGINKLYKNIIYRTHANTVVSTKVNNTETNITTIGLTATATSNDATTRNTGINYFVSNNGGSKWHKVNSGDFVTFPDSGTDDLRWKAELSSLSPVRTPLLLQIKLALSIEPVITLPAAPTLNEDSVNVEINDNIGITDEDGNNQTVTLTITGGTVSIGTSNISFATGDGTDNAELVFSGTLADINAALDAMTFTPTANLNGSNAGTIQIQTDDGAGKTDDDTLQFDIIAQNDAPEISGTPSTSWLTSTWYSFVPVASDIDLGDVLTFSIVNKPVWASFNSATGELSGMPARADAGVTTNIQISVTDSQAVVSLPLFNLEVSRN